MDRPMDVKPPAGGGILGLLREVLAEALSGAPPSAALRGGSTILWGDVTSPAMDRRADAGRME